MKKKESRYNFNVYLNQEDRDIVTELINRNVNVSGVFKTFIRQYLDKVKKLENEDNKIN